MRDHRWLIVAALLLVIAVHVLLFAFAVPHAGASTAVVAAIAAVVVVKHVGLLAPLFALLRRKRPPSSPG